MLPAPMRPMWIIERRPTSLRRARLLQQRLHPGKTLAARFFRRAAPLPVLFESPPPPIAVLPQRAELRRPVDHTAAHRGPLPRFAVGALHGVLAVHVTDAPLGDLCVTVRVRNLVAVRRVAGIPVELERRLLNRVQQARRLRARGRVAGHLVFDDEREAALPRLDRGGPNLL